MKSISTPVHVHDRLSVLLAGLALLALALPRAQAAPAVHGPLSKLVLVPAALGSSSGSAPPAPATSLTPAPPTAPASGPVSVTWLSVDAQHPRIIFVGGILGCTAGQTCGGGIGTVSCFQTLSCQSWMMRSTDGGASWADLSVPLGVAALPVGNVAPVYAIDPVLLAPDGRHVYASYFSSSGSPASGAYGVLVSADEGITWQSTGEGQGGSYGGGTRAIALSPLSPTRLYGEQAAGGGEPTRVVASDDGGQHWRSVGSPGSGPFQRMADRLIADPRHLNTVYVNIFTAEEPMPRLVTRSEDGGLTWTAVTTPTATPPLRTFAVSTDPSEGTLLVGRTADAGVPADRRYLSADSGRTWRVATCPGDLQGTCPAFTLANVFGVGASYAFVHDGVYRFHRDQPAEDRLQSIARLPVRTADLIAVGGGARAGDPVYLLGQGSVGAVHGVLYMSSDGGHSWRQRAAGMLPTAAPPSQAPGALYVTATHHSVAPTFVAAYRRLGASLVGAPLTEAYLEGTTLTQDFQHLRLELARGKVVVGDLGAVVLRQHPDLQYPTSGPYGPVAPVPNTATRLYFPQTHHTLQGDLLRYWQQHGGMTVFGAPLTEVVSQENGDGTGQTYEVQWFQNARLERHPELQNPHYAVLLGLLGKASLHDRGWLP